MRVLGLVAAAALISTVVVPAEAGQTTRIALRDGWSIQSSAEVTVAAA